MWNNAEQDVLIPVGKITGTHGVRGQLKVHSYSGNMDSLVVADTVVIKTTENSVRRYEIGRVSAIGGKIVFGLKDFNSISQVQEFIGSEICLFRSQFPETEENEYYWRDLLGLEVVTINGEALGSVADIFETGSNDVYVVQGKEREYLIPAVASVITTIDLENRRMVITPLEGLLEL